MKLIEILFSILLSLCFILLQPSVVSATNIDTLLANKEGIDCVKVPPETLQDKVFFIFNNLSMSNMDQKVGIAVFGLVNGFHCGKIISVYL